MIVWHNAARMQAREDRFYPLPPLFVTGVVLAGLVTNVGLSLVNESIPLPFFMDSIGTAVAVVTVGLGPAMIVAVGTNALFELAYGMDLEHLPFALCGIASALIIHAFVRRGRFSTLGDALVLSLLVALANALCGAVIAAFLYGGVTGVGIDYLVSALVASGQSMLGASFWARVPANIVDKSIAVGIAFFAREPLLRLATRLIPTEPRRG